MLLVLVLRNRRRMRLVLRLKRLWWREGKVRALYKANLHTEDIGVGRGHQVSTTKLHCFRKERPKNAEAYSYLTTTVAKLENFTAALISSREVSDTLD